MKTLQQHLTESLVNEAYKAQFKQTEWENVLKQVKPAYSNYSQLCGLESCVGYIQDGYADGVMDWVNDMIAGGVQDTPENREVLTDIINWTAANYETVLLGWWDNIQSILDYIDDMDKNKTIWGSSEEDYARFMIPLKKLSGNDKKLGELLAKYGNSGDLEEMASRYSDEW